MRLLLVLALLTAPTTGQDVASLERAFADLADADPIVRSDARRTLMGLDGEDLGDLRELVRRSRPIAPEQAAALREIVLHVLLAAVPRDAVAEEGGFLGVRMAQTAPRFDEPEAPVEPSAGVAVETRILGFDAYRMLEDGDILRALDGTAPIASPQDLVNALRGRAAGETVVLTVLRGGRVLEVPVRLAARPDQARFDGWQQARLTEARARWTRDFEPLVAPGFVRDAP